MAKVTYYVTASVLNGRARPVDGAVKVQRPRGSRIVIEETKRGKDGQPWGRSTGNRWWAMRYLSRTRPGAAGGRIPSPVPGYGVSYPYGVRNPRYQAGFHTGEDRKAPHGTPVVSVRAGTVVRIGYDSDGYGRFVVVRCDDGTGHKRDYWHNHLSSHYVRVGQKVGAGHRIGRVGQTGQATGNHHHLEDRPAGGGYGRVRKPYWK